MVVVLVGDADKGLDNVKPLASQMDFILAVGSPDRLKVMVQPTVDKILQGDLHIYRTLLELRNQVTCKYAYCCSIDKGLNGGAHLSMVSS